MYFFEGCYASDMNTKNLTIAANYFRHFLNVVNELDEDQKLDLRDIIGCMEVEGDAKVLLTDVLKSLDSI